MVKDAFNDQPPPKDKRGGLIRFVFLVLLLGGAAFAYLAVTNGPDAQQHPTEQSN